MSLWQDRSRQQPADKTVLFPVRLWAGEEPEKGEVYGESIGKTGLLQQQKRCRKAESVHLVLFRQYPACISGGERTVGGQLGL